MNESVAAGVAHQPNSPKVGPVREGTGLLQGEAPPLTTASAGGGASPGPWLGVRGGSGAGLKGPKCRHPHRPNQFSETQLPRPAAPPEARALEPSPPFIEEKLRP